MRAYAQHALIHTHPRYSSLQHILATNTLLTSPPPASLFIQFLPFIHLVSVSQSNIPAEFFDRYAEQFRARAQQVALSSGRDPAEQEEKAE